MTKTTGNFTDFVSFSRASGGTYRDANGDLQTAGVNTPRIDHDEDGNLKGLLIEEARTNLFLNSGNPETQVCSVTPGTSYTLGFTSGAATVDLDETIAATAVDVFVYDTSKDSDGGAWRTGALAQASSWYNETLNTATRGSRREFPAVAVIVAEAAKVTIYDGDDPALPMWMVFNLGLTNGFWSSTATATSLSMQDATLAVGSNAVGHRQVNFVSEKFVRSFTSSIGGQTGGIINRNAVLVAGPSDGPVIVNSTVNDVAMTVLPDAPIDPATGLPVPTIAVATAGGVSVIKDDGTVVSKSSGISSYSAHNVCNKMVFNPDHTLFFGVWNGATPFAAVVYDAGLTTKVAEYGLYTSNSGSDLDVVRGYYIRAIESEALGTAVGLHLSKENRAGVSTSLLATVTSTYNTGWMNGDIKGAFLSSTDTASLVGSGELVTNGTFDTDTSGWTALDAILSQSSGQMTITNNLDSQVRGAYQALSTEAGKTYVAKIDLVSKSSFFAYFYVGTTANGAQLGSLTGGVMTGGNTYQITFTAVGSTSYVFLGTYNIGKNIVVDNVSVKLADADRSVNNNGLIVNGTVTRSAVATGAELVAYSGFSASNYLEQPYNSALDFGTGDFCVMGWVNGTKSGQIFDRFDAAETGARFSIVLSGSYTRFFTSSGFFDASALSDGPSFVVMLRRSGVLYGYINGLLVGTVACTGSLTNTSANLRVGTRANTGASPLLGSLALLRISATAPTADQIAKIYEDEKVLFQAGAQATLYGTSGAVTALAHDPDTGLLHVGTSAGRSVFQGLRRINNTTTGVTTAISATNGIIAEQ